jgi:hypothetical protein
LQSTDAGGVATDFTTYQQIWFTCKRANTDLDSAAVFQKTLGGGIVIVPSDHSKVNIIINPTDTSGLTITGSSLSLLYDIETKDAGGNINTPQSGQIILLPDITRSA